MLVHTPRGCLPLEELAYGDKVLSLDTDGGRLVARHVRVTGLSRRPEPALVELDLGEKVLCSPEQSLWVLGSGWLPARSLVRGAALLAWDGSRRAVRSLRVRRGELWSQELQTEQGRGYFAGGIGVLMRGCVSCT